MYRFLCEHKFPFFLGQMPKSTTAWLHSNCMFSFTRKLPSCFPEWLYHFYQQCMSDSVSLHLMSFLILVFLIGIQWHLIVVLMCIYSLVNDIEHLFMCLLAICAFSFVKCLFRSFTLLFGVFNIFFLPCYVACRLLVPPNQGSNPHPLQWKHGVLTTWPSKKSNYLLFLTLQSVKILYMFQIVFLCWKCGLQVFSPYL